MRLANPVDALYYLKYFTFPADVDSVPAGTEGGGGEREDREFAVRKEGRESARGARVCV